MWTNIHRRHRNVESYDWWEYLNYAQKFSVSSLFKYGYKIRFVRREEHKSMVVMSLEGNDVTVDEDGFIDTSPDIELRQSI